MTCTQSYAIWITGLPSSGKSTIAKALARMLREKGAVAAILESDELRKILTPDATYSPEERAVFYRQMALLGAMLVKTGISVIFDATANRRSYRDYARSLIGRFLEVYVDCPLSTCAARDPKGIYAAAAARRSTNVPGIDAAYEPPPSPDITVSCNEDPGEAAERIIAKLRALEYL
jgi:adenylylsulfate kinase